MLTLYHAPQSRAFSILWMIEELAVPYAIEPVDIRAEGGAPESYRAVQPHKKVPAIIHDGVTITERAAISAHLADAFPEAGLAPPIGDPRRGPYLSWLVYVDAVIDPALAAKVLGWSYAPGSLSFGAYDDMAAHVERSLAGRDYVVGESCTAADIQLAAALHWATAIVRAMPATPVLQAYLQRMTGRPGFRRAVETDAQAMEAGAAAGR